MNKRIIFASVIIIVGVAYYAYSHFFSGQGQQAMQNGAPPVSVAEVVGKNIRRWNSYSGRLTAVDQVEIRSRVPGTIESIHFKDGALVKKGDLLFVIDPRPYEASLQAAEARSSFADTELKRGGPLLKRKVISESNYDQRKNDAAVAKAELTNAKLNLEYTHITSPIDGKVSRAEITEGNLVETGANAPVLTSVVSTDPLYADFEIDENTYLQYLHTNQHITDRIPVMMGLATDNDAPYEGRISSFDNQLNTATGTIRVRAVFDNKEGKLIPGLFARIKLGSVDKIESFLITDRAIGTDQNKKFVLVVGNDNIVAYREVKLGPVVDGLRVITEGLKAGEKIIVNGLQRARPGAPVTPSIVSMEPEQAPAQTAELIQ